MYDQTEGTTAKYAQTGSPTTTGAPEREMQTWGQLNRQEGAVTGLHDVVSRLTSRLQPLLSGPTLNEQAQQDAPAGPSPLAALPSKISAHTDAINYAAMRDPEHPRQPRNVGRVSPG